MNFKIINFTTYSIFEINARLFKLHKMCKFCPFFSILRRYIKLNCIVILQILIKVKKVVHRISWLVEKKYISCKIKKKLILFLRDHFYRDDVYRISFKIKLKLKWKQ